MVLTYSNASLTQAGHKRYERNWAEKCILCVSLNYVTCLLNSSSTSLSHKKDTGINKICESW